MFKVELSVLVSQSRSSVTNLYDDSFRSTSKIRTLLILRKWLLHFAYYLIS